MNDDDAPVLVGHVYRTPFEPSGLFKVLELQHGGESAFGVFVGDHPHGYKDGQVGRYLTKELAGREQA